MMRSRSTGVKGPARAGGADSNVLFEAWRLSRAASSLLDGALGPSGLSADEFGVYSVLAGAGSITPTELARWMAAAPTTVSSYVQRFERRGHVERSRHPGDGRSYRIRLTPAGRRAHRDAAALFAPTLARVVRALGDAEPGARRTLDSLLAAIESVRTPDAAGPRP
jgi:DNA-binding MarR family transcriptional regulator